jgi:hypothetical protein
VVIEKTKLSVDSELNWPSKANRQILQAIEENNRNHSIGRLLFDSAMLGFVEKIRDLESTPHYFFNICCHSNVGGYRLVMKRILNKLLSSRVANVVFAFHYCTSHFASLYSILLNALKALLLDFLSGILVRSQVEDGFGFLTRSLELLPTAIEINFRELAKMFIIKLLSVFYQKSIPRTTDAKWVWRTRSLRRDLEIRSFWIVDTNLAGSVGLKENSEQTTAKSPIRFS